MYQRGFAIISFILVIFLLSGAIIGGSFYIKDKGSILHRSASTIPSVDKPQTQTTERPTQIYTNTQMGFSINYPSGNLAYESKEETYFWDNELSGKSFIITNDAFSTVDPEIKTKKFNEFREAKEGPLQTDSPDLTEIKVKNLDVDGNPAVELILDYKPSDKFRNASVGMTRPPFYSIVVYINRGETFWEVYNELPDKERGEKSLKNFEYTLSTLKLLN